MNMNQQELNILFWLAIVLMPFMWFATTRMFNAWTGFSTKLQENTGQLVSQTSWGSGKIGIFSASGCIKLLVYEDGFALKMMPLFGGGLLWIPKDMYSVVAIRPAKFLMPLRADLEFNGIKIRLFGALAEPFA